MPVVIELPWLTIIVFANVSYISWYAACCSCLLYMSLCLSIYDRYLLLAENILCSVLFKFFFFFLQLPKGDKIQMILFNITTTTTTTTTTATNITISGLNTLNVTTTTYGFYVLCVYVCVYSINSIQMGLIMFKGIFIDKKYLLKAHTI